MAGDRPVESPLEWTVLQAIRDAGLPEPDRQIEVFDRGGKLVGRADFGYRSSLVVLQVHSRMWHTSVEDVERDEAQRNRYIAAGWMPVVARTNDIQAGGEFLGALREALSQRAA